jgi:FkbM family methyltransferase
VEVLLVMVLTAVVSGVVARDYGRRDEDGWLRAAYGSTHWSNGPEEWIARDFFQDRRGGVFVDVGSADAREGSNTYYLEAQLGWSGIAVDALAEYGPTYLTHRPKTQFFPLFVGDHSDDRAVIYVANGQTTVSSVSRDFSTFYADEDDVTARSVPTITLNDLLVKSGVTHVDFLSMDIELSEPMALAGFDLAKYKPALVTVEAHPPIRQLLIDHFVERGYTVVGKYLWVDPANIWFIPKQ